MRRLLPILLAACLIVPDAARPDTSSGPTTLVTTRALKARSIVTREDVATHPGATAGALSTPDEAVGMETRAWLQSGKPIMADDLAPAAVVERNQLVSMRFRKGALEITTEGRALERAAPGEPLRVMNLSSRSVVTARAVGPGVVEVR